MPEASRAGDLCGRLNLSPLSAGKPAIDGKEYEGGNGGIGRKIGWKPRERSGSPRTTSRMDGEITDYSRPRGHSSAV